MIDIKDRIEKLKNFYNTRPEISMAFVFGSYAKERQISESDIDIAVYFKPKGREIEWEEQKKYSNEGEIWVETERILGVDTDLVVLNRAASSLAFEILRTGIPIIIKTRYLYLSFLLIVSDEAEYYKQIAQDWWAIRERSRSLGEDDKLRLARAVMFLEKELKDIDSFSNLDQAGYMENNNLRRAVERWTENIVNSSIDIAKIILASEKEALPSKYSEVLVTLGKYEEIGRENAKMLSEFAKLRNLLAHEYLDLRFSKIKEFLASAKDLYGKLLEFSKKIINRED